MPTEQRPLLSTMPHVYAIAEWSELFETADSRKWTRPLEWVRMPTQHDRRGYMRVMQLPNRDAIYLAWCLMVQEAALMPCRGVFAHLGGPLDAPDLAEKTRLRKPNAFRMAMAELIKPEIGWLVKLEWLSELQFWENIERLGLTPAYVGRQKADTERKRRTRADTGGQPKESVPRNQARNGRTPEDAGGHGTKRAEAAGHGLDKIRLDNSTDPPAVPQGDAHASGSLIRDVDEAKRLICEKIFGGRNPARMWSGDAENRLAFMCKDAGGVSLQEILDIAVYRSTPENDAIPELRRRPVLTETSLMQHWNDEADRSRNFLAKYPRQVNGTRKKEPAHWREFFQHKYGEGVRLPATFDELDADLHAEWQREHEMFEQEVAA